MKKNVRLFLIVALVLQMVLPIVGSFFKWGGFPDGYGEFPSREAGNDPGFCPFYFTFGVFVAFVILVFILFPRLFGFKKPLGETNVPQTDSAVGAFPGFPMWFWPGVIIMVVSWVLMWGRFPALTTLEKFSFVPLWWGLILALDGLVYKRNGGKSIISHRPNVMKVMIVISCLSWFFFEYLNFFVLSNWYYPNRDVLLPFGYIFWYSLSYTTVLPAIFEWFVLLKTFKSLRIRYSEGPAMSFPDWIIWGLFLGGLGVAFFMGFLPYIFFWGLWVSPFLLFTSALSLTGSWHPLTPIKKGNWTDLMVMALAGLLTGFFWELWNFGSLWFHPDLPINPNYWRYSVPYLDYIHIFSEMPILGYFGYLFFGIGCWVLWLVGAYICKYDPVFDVTEPTGAPVQEE